MSENLGKILVLLQEMGFRITFNLPPVKALTSYPLQLFDFVLITSGAYSYSPEEALLLDRFLQVLTQERP